MTKPKLDNTQNYTLENARVLLRPLESNDLAHLLTFAENEPELWTYSLMPASGKENMENYLNRAVKFRQLGLEYPFIVWDKSKGAYAGSTRFYDIETTSGYLQLGYTWYGKEFQGTGLNRNCKYLMLAFAFDQCGFERVEFRADNNNARSIAAMKGIGCTVEGVLRSHTPKPDGSGRRDSIVLSILKAEWESHVKENLLNRMLQDQL